MRGFEHQSLKYWGRVSMQCWRASFVMLRSQTRKEECLQWQTAAQKGWSPVALHSQELLGRLCKGQKKLLEVINAFKKTRAEFAS